MLTVRSVLLACALLVALAPSSSSFIYFLDPTDVSDHFICALNASMSPRALQKIAATIQNVADITRNHTGDADTFRGLLPDEIIEKMKECESYNRRCFRGGSSEGTGSESSESLLANFNPLSSLNDTETDPECEPEYYFPLLVRCYKETDLMYFKSLTFNDESDQAVDLFRECLEDSIFYDDDEDDDDA